MQKFEKINTMHLILFFFLWFAFSLFLKELAYSFAYAIILGIIIFFGKNAFKKFSKHAEIKLFERDFGFALMHLSTQLNIGISFESALKTAQTIRKILPQTLILR